MTQESTAKNGARAKILLTLAREGMLPVAEIAEFTRMTAKQVRDNSTMARAEGLISSERDEVTRQLAFKITPAGRKWVADHVVAEKITARRIDAQTRDEEASETEPTAEESSVVEASASEIEDEARLEVGAVVKDSLTTQEPEALADEIEIDDFLDFAPELPELPDAVQPSSDRPIYAITFYAGVEIVGSDLDMAIERAIAFASGGDTVARVYQLVPIGETYTTVGFRHAAPAAA